MTKSKEIFTCPCESYEFKILIESEDKIEPISYCPICGITVDLSVDEYEEDYDS